MALYLVLLMAAPGPAGGEARLLLPGAEDFDLAREVAPARCDERAGGAIVVCGRRKAEDIVIRDPGRFAQRPLRAEVKLPSGASVDMHAEQRSLPGGRSGPAAMVRVRIPF
jgi:hypothetical protein